MQVSHMDLKNFYFLKLGKRNKFSKDGSGKFLSPWHYQGSSKNNNKVKSIGINRIVIAHLPP